MRKKDDVMKDIIIIRLFRPAAEIGPCQITFESSAVPFLYLKPYTKKKRNSAQNCSNEGALTALIP